MFLKKIPNPLTAPQGIREHLLKYNLCLIRTFKCPSLSFSLSSNKSKKGKKCTMKIIFLVIDFKQYDKMIKVHLLFALKLKTFHMLNLKQYSELTFSLRTEARN